jgi:uncharacterized membrane protein
MPSDARRTLGRCLVTLGVAAAAQSAAAEPSFTGIGQIPIGTSTSTRLDAVSGDGAVAAGYSEWSGVDTRPIAWTAAGGIELLDGNLEQGYPFYTSVANDVSSDGSIRVGWFISRAVRWNAAGDYFDIGHLPPINSSVSIQLSRALAVSGDGSKIVGVTKHVLNCPPQFPPFLCASIDQSFVWTEGEGMVVFPYGTPSDISQAGDVIVGTTVPASAGAPVEAFRFSASDGYLELDTLPGHTSSGARGVSADGSTVVGQSTAPSVAEAFRWTAVGGMTGLGFLPGASSSLAMAASGDGAVVVGDSGGHAFLWDAVNGMRDLKDFATSELGLDLTNWTLKKANAISADATTIVGDAVNPSGATEGFVMVIPEPSNEVLLVAGLAGLAVLGRRRRREARAAR